MNSYAIMQRYKWNKSKVILWNAHSNSLQYSCSICSTVFEALLCEGNQVNLLKRTVLKSWNRKRTVCQSTKRDNDYLYPFSIMTALFLYTLKDQYHTYVSCSTHYKLRKIHTGEIWCSQSTINFWFTNLIFLPYMAEVFTITEGYVIITGLAC